jgi:hypothetical protein
MKYGSHSLLLEIEAALRERDVLIHALRCEVKRLKSLVVAVPDLLREQVLNSDEEYDKADALLKHCEKERERA